MAKGQYFTPRQQSIVKGYYEHQDTAAAQKLGEIVSDLYLAVGTPKADKLWEGVGKALARTKANPVEVAKVLAEKNLEGLARIVNQIAGGKPAPTSGGEPSAAPAKPAPPPPPPPGGPNAAPSSEVLRQAIKAFKKRLKLTRLDEESKLGRSPMTSGAQSRIIAIIPPNQYPRAVWEALVKEGRLKYTGQGFYELVEGA